MKGHPIPESKIREIIDKAEKEHRTLSDVAREYKVSVSVISRYRYLKGQIVRKHRSLTDAQIKEIKKRYTESGQSGPKIAKEMGIAHAYVYEFVGKGFRQKTSSRLQISLSKEGKSIGSDNPNYRHGRSKDYHRSSFFLDAWSRQVKERDKYTCQMCGSKLNPEAHHIIATVDTRVDKNPLLLVSISNGITLCKNPCHFFTAHRETEYETMCNQLLEKAAKRGNS
jgi:hypothetical protein